MPAFTNLCRRANVSLTNNTLTLYSKTADDLSLAGIVGRYEQLFEQMNIHFVKEDEDTHDDLHEDLFQKEVMHFHFQLPDETNETLENMLNCFVKVKILDYVEKENFLTALKAASDWENQTIFNYFNEGDEHFLSTLQAIKMLALTYEKEQRPDLLAATKAIHSKLFNHFESFAKDRSTNTYESLKNACKNALEEYSLVEEQDFRLKKLLQNTNLVINGMGRQYGLAETNTAVSGTDIADKWLTTLASKKEEIFNAASTSRAWKFNRTNRQNWDTLLASIKACHSNEQILNVVKDSDFYKSCSKDGQALLDKVSPFSGSFHRDALAKMKGEDAAAQQHTDSNNDCEQPIARTTF